MNSLPVASSVYNLADLSDNLIEEYANFAGIMIQTLLEATDLNGPVIWHIVQEKHGVSLFRSEIGSVSPCNVHAVCKVASDDMSSVMNSITTDSSEKYRKMMRKLSDNFIDGALLHTVVPRTEEHPNRFIGIKWASFKSSTPFSKDKDYVFLEYTDIFTTYDGQMIGFRAMQSVFLPDFPSLEDSHRLQRSEMPLTGFLFYSTKNPNILKMTYTCQFEPWAELPSWAVNTAIQSHVERCISRTVKYLEEEVVYADDYVGPEQWIPSSERLVCAVCKRSFTLIRHRHHCRKCGEVVCSNCTTIKNTEIPVVGEMNVRVCTACSLISRQSRRASTESWSKSFSRPTSSDCSSPMSTGNPRGRAHSSNNEAASYSGLLSGVATYVNKHKAFSSTPVGGQVNLKELIIEEEKTDNQTADYYEKVGMELRKETSVTQRATFDLPQAIERSKNLIETTEETNELAKHARLLAMAHLQARDTAQTQHQNMKPATNQNLVSPIVTSGRANPQASAKKLVLFSEESLKKVATSEISDNDLRSEQRRPNLTVDSKVGTGHNPDEIPSCASSPAVSPATIAKRRQQAKQQRRRLGSESSVSIARKESSAQIKDENLEYNRNQSAAIEYEKEARCCLFGFY